MGPNRMARRGLTPLLVLLVVAPPRVCTCDDDYAAEPTPIACLADPPADHDQHDHDDSDCPCLKPTQMEPTVLASAAPALPAAQSAVSDRPSAGPVGDSPAPPDRRTGDPPRYLTGCALRF